MASTNCILVKRGTDKTYKADISEVTCTRCAKYVKEAPENNGVVTIKPKKKKVKPMANEFESQINKLISYINKSGYHAHKNHPQRLHNGQYIDGEPFDFEIMLPDYKACFDAKGIHQDVWKFEKKDIEQADHLKHCKNAGVDSFFLVYFYKFKKMVKFDVDIFLKALAEKRKHLKVDEGTVWKEWEKCKKI